MDDPFADTNDSPTMGGDASPREREAYQVPDRSAVPMSAPRGLGIDDPGALVKYNCGDCASEQRFSRGGVMRCSECGGRMFYKQRTKRMVQFEAR